MKSTRCLALAALLCAAAPAAAQVQLNGAGATFPNIIYQDWMLTYNQTHPDVKLNYQSIGSGGGIRQFSDGTVDFGATDAPMIDSAIAAIQGNVLHIPTVMGAVVIIFNLQGVTQVVRLTPDVLADIFLGKVTKWNDARLASINPGVTLPAADIIVVHRAEGSGTSYAFTDYLSKVSPEWKDKVGEGTSVAWPTGVGGKGNEGVASYVQRIDGAIGYVEYAYAKQNKLAVAKMTNRERGVVAPSDKTFAAAAAGADWKKAAGMHLVLTDQPGKDSWPMTGASFILMHTQQAKPQNAKEVLKFFDWAFKNGDRMASELDYVPMPDAVVHLIQSEWKAKLKDTAGKPVY